jgi:hypothetical protein
MALFAWTLRSPNSRSQKRLLSGDPGHQLCFAGLKPLRHRFEFVLPETT